MKLLRFACAAVLTAGVVFPAFAADSPWNGTWKLNNAKSKTTGDTYTVSQTKSGMYHFSNGGTVEFDYACDGKEYTILADRTQTCTESSPSVEDYTFKAHGTTLRTEHQTLSSDGKMLSVTGVNLRPDGTSSTSSTTYQRVSGTSGFVGKWKDVKDSSASDVIMLIKVADGVMHTEVPAYKEICDAKLDGTDSPVTGPTIPPGATNSIKQESASRVHFANKLDGKVLWEGTETLSSDGKTLTYEEWVPGKMEEKTTVIYEKQ